MRKKSKLYVFLTIMIAILIFSTAAVCYRCGDKTDEEVIPGEDKISSEESDEIIKSVDVNLLDGNTEFSFKIFRELVTEDKDENIFISPLSISTALAMTYNGAEGETKEEMAEALEFKGISLEDLNQGFKDLMVGIQNADDEIELNIANSIWLREGFDCKEDFLDRNRKYFSSEVEEIDFSSPDAPGIINSWIEDATEGKIEKMIDEISLDVVMYLINAIYFKGNWTYEFDEDATEEKNFYLLDGSLKKVPMMAQSEEFSYFEGDNFSSVRLPYGEEKTAMYVILPDEGVNPDTVISSLNAEKWNEYTGSFYRTEASILMPKFKMEYGIKLLNDTLTSLGMGTAFSQMADFSGINPDVYISRVLHKAVIEVNEKGSEAAAVTVVEVAETAMVVDIVEFIVNRPFIFVISDDRSGSILFMGKVVNP